MEDENYIYLRFPVQILKCDFGNMKKLCNDAINYGVIERMKKHNLTGIEGFGKACELVGIKVLINKHSFLKKCNDTYNQYKDSVETIITCSIKRDLLFEFMDKPKTEFEITVFRFFIALNSIQGMKKYGQATYDRVYAVMFGYNTDKVLEKDGLKMALLTEAERKIYLQYSTRKIRENIINTLQMDYYLKWYPAGKKGNFYSYKLGRRALATIVETLKSNDRKRKNALLGANKKAKEWAVNELKTNGLYY